VKPPNEVREEFTGAMPSQAKTPKKKKPKTKMPKNKKVAIIRRE
jgi:hypothetical protein